jgi:hypothetical protein
VTILFWIYKKNKVPLILCDRFSRAYCNDFLDLAVDFWKLFYLESYIEAKLPATPWKIPKIFEIMSNFLIQT